MLWCQKNLVMDKSAIYAIQVFSIFFYDTIIENITQQTNLYATQKDVNTSFSTTNLETLQFFLKKIYIKIKYQ